MKTQIILAIRDYCKANPDAELARNILYLLVQS